MRIIIPFLFLFMIGFVSSASAQPLDQINSEIINSTGNFATIKISWNPDSSVSSYTVGCISCIPNISENTTKDSIILENLTTLKDGSVWLYVIAYNQSTEIINAIQIIVPTK